MFQIYLEKSNNVLGRYDCVLTASHDGSVDFPEIIARYGIVIVGRSMVLEIGMDTMVLRSTVYGLR